MPVICRVGISLLAAVCQQQHLVLTACCAGMCRHGPAFGTTASQEEDGSDPLCEVLAVNGRRCSLADRNDVLCRHVTGAMLPHTLSSALEGCS